MIGTESFKREMKRYFFLVVAVLILEGIIVTLVTTLISSYVPFLGNMGIVSTYIIKFIALAIIIIPTDLILQRTI